MLKGKEVKGQLVVSKLPEVRWDGELTNSARSTFLTCRKKFEWSYLRRLSPRAPSIPFLVGGLYHNGLERMYRDGHFDEDEERDTVSKACEEACLTPGLTVKQSDEIWEQQAQVMGLLRGYAKRYLANDKKIWKVLETEKSFTYPLQPGWRARGKRDMVVRRRADGKIGLVEHKTARSVDAKYVAKLPLDNQIQGYANALKKSMGKLPDFVVYNVAKKSQLRKKQSETFEAYCKRVENDFVLNPANYYYRETLIITQTDAQRYETEQRRFAVEMERAIKEKYFYLNTNACTQMGICPFMGLCISGPTRENLSKFRERVSTHEELSVEEVLN